MGGWLALLVLIAGAIAVLHLLHVRGPLLKAAAAALLLGAAGYSLQGRPSLPDSFAKPSEDADFVSLATARHAFFGEFTAAESWLRMSDALASGGNGEDAVNLLQNAVRRSPGDAQLWVGLGNALVDHAHGLTPPAEMAYRRAAEVAPGYPGPQFFYGLAQLRSGDRTAALRSWSALLADAPPNASWRPIVERGVALLSQSVPPSAAAPAP